MTILSQAQIESDWLNEQIAPSFKRREFVCPCCNHFNLNGEFLDKLQKAHDLLPPHTVMIINSGCRCDVHNSIVGGSHTSSHLKGLAADIKCFSDEYRWHLQNALMLVGFTRFGVGKEFIHVDCDPDKKQKRMWTYYGGE